ncbi:c-type cytochrome [Zoogloeaceae bacterium G21618-S1]|nr:c-type cytochrome [Zoogloeaceae bacterium G21618-S1]
MLPHALVLAGLLAPAAFVQAADLPDVDLTRAGQIVAERCSLCHGVDGESSTANHPKLAGQHFQYIAKQLADFQSGKRASDTMGSMVTDLSAEDMLALGVYFEKKPARARRVLDEGLNAVGKFIFDRGNEYSGVAACASCHGEKGYGTDKLPRLAGQNARYLETQLESFNSRARTNDNAIMHTIATKLTELETKAVSVYISTLE